MSSYKNAGRPFVTKDYQDDPVVHKGRAADILRIVLRALADAGDLPNGAITIDFGNTEASAQLSRNYPRIKLTPPPV